jgi:hypothetical protein
MPMECVPEAAVVAPRPQAHIVKLDDVYLSVAVGVLRDAHLISYIVEIIATNFEYQITASCCRAIFIDKLLKRCQ